MCAGTVYTALQTVLPEKLINKILTDKQEKQKSRLNWNCFQNKYIKLASCQAGR